LHHLVAADFIGQTVAAKQDDIAVSQDQLVDRDVDVRRSAERLKDDVLVSMLLSLFLGDMAGLDELADQRLIARDLLYDSTAIYIGPAVAYLSEVSDVAVQSRGRECGAHA